MKEDNKDVKLLNEELWSKRMSAEIMMMERKTTADKNNRIKEIRRNNTREKEVVQVLKKKDELT